MAFTMLSCTSASMLRHIGTLATPRIACVSSCSHGSGGIAPLFRGTRSCLRKPFLNLYNGANVASGQRNAVVAAAAATTEPVDVEADWVDTRTPVTVLTGFLGSGKTTLLNHILTAGHGKRIFVIMNEYGEVDIDSSLVTFKESLDGTSENMLISLDNGCACCPTVRGDLMNVLYEIVDREEEYDQILIETSGLAEPAPIIATFHADYEIQDKLRIDGVLTLVDAKHVEMHLDEERPDDAVNEALQQIAYADRIVLNKTDLVDEAQLARLERRIRAINGMAQVTRAQRGNVPVDYVLGIGGFDIARIARDMEQPAGQAAGSSDHSHGHDHEHHQHGDIHHQHEAAEAHDHRHAHEHASSSSGAHGSGHAHGHDEHAHDHHHHHDHDHGHTGHEHKHNDAVSSVSFVLDGELDSDEVQYYLSAMLELKGNDIYRTKGILAFENVPERVVIQGVHQQMEAVADRPWGPGEKRQSKLVFIGKDLDKELLREGLEACLVDSDV